MLVKFIFCFKKFNGDPLSTALKIEENIEKSRDILSRGIEKFSQAKTSVFQSSHDKFEVEFNLPSDHSESEDVLAGILESNIMSASRRGILSLGLHEWELDVS